MYRYIVLQIVRSLRCPESSIHSWFSIVYMSRFTSNLKLCPALLYLAVMMITCQMSLYHKVKLALLAEIHTSEHLIQRQR